MSRGKYSPWCYHNRHDASYEFNCYGEFPEDWNKEDYDEKTMFADYDAEGFDCYGYSAFYLDGRYAGVGRGIDRYGFTGNDYLSMDVGVFESISWSAEELTSFIRERDGENATYENEDVVKTELDQILSKWNNLDTNVETPMAFDAVVQTANEVIDALAALVQKQK